MADELEAALALEAEIEAESRGPYERFLDHVDALEAAEAEHGAAVLAEAQADHAATVMIEELVMDVVDCMASGVARQIYAEHTFVRSVPPLQLLAHRFVAECQQLEMAELNDSLECEKETELMKLRLAADAEIVAIRAKLARELSAAEHAHMLRATQETRRVEGEYTGALEGMQPSLDAVAEGWAKCTGKECTQLFRPEERTKPAEGCSSETCTMHKRYCDDCCEHPAWPSSMCIRGHREDDDEPYRDLVLCNWCEEFLCPECYRGHEAACAAAHKGRCGYQVCQQYIAADCVHDEERVGIVGKAMGHCGGPGTERCRHGEDCDVSCGVVMCTSCAWTCSGYCWSGMDEEEKCQTQLCQLHAPAPGKGRKRARYSYIHCTDQYEEAPEGMCGECDGELPDRKCQHETRVANAQYALERAHRNRDYALWGM